MQYTSKVARFFELLLAHWEFEIKGKIAKIQIRLLFCVVLLAVAMIYFTVGAGLPSVMSAEMQLANQVQMSVGTAGRAKSNYLTAEAGGHMLLTIDRCNLNITSLTYSWLKQEVAEVST